MIGGAVEVVVDPLSLDVFDVVEVPRVGGVAVAVSPAGVVGLASVACSTEGLEEDDDKLGTGVHSSADDFVNVCGGGLSAHLTVGMLGKVFITQRSPCGIVSNPLLGAAVDRRALHVP